MSVGLLPRRLWELFAGAELLQAKETVGVMIAMALPEAMKVTIRQAKKAKSIGDREHFLKIARALPTPKGSTTNINLPGQKDQEETEVEEESELEGMATVLKNLQSDISTPKQLPAATVIDADQESEG